MFYHVFYFYLLFFSFLRVWQLAPLFFFFKGKQIHSTKELNKYIISEGYEPTQTTVSHLFKVSLTKKWAITLRDLRVCWTLTAWKLDLSLNGIRPSINHGAYSNLTVLFSIRKWATYLFILCWTLTAWKSFILLYTSAIIHWISILLLFLLLTKSMTS